MPSERRPPGRWIGNLLIALGILVFGLGIGWMTRADAPLEEPATPGATPNPSTTPWHDETELEWQYFWWDVEHGAIVLALPALGVVLLLVGSILTVRARGPDDPPA